MWLSGRKRNRSCKGPEARAFCHAHRKQRKLVCRAERAFGGEEKELILWAMLRTLDFTLREITSPGRFLT